MNKITQRSIHPDSTRVIDLTAKDIKDLFADAVREAVSEFKNMESSQAPSSVQYLTRKEAARLLKITLPTLWEWVKSGKIRSYKIGRRVLFKPQEIDEMLSEQLKIVRR
jgi:excisionase family DNA binding protein